MEETGEDRISRLPDHLIHHIMSFNDTKYAVQTCVLSKRWIDVWKSLPFLVFNRSSFSEDKKNNFIVFVDMVFILRCKNFDIRRFSVHWEKSAYDCTVNMNVNRWCVNAVMHNVEDIWVRVTQCYDSAYDIPHHILNCKSLRNFEIQMGGEDRNFVDITLPRSMNLPRLKRLYLFGVCISNVESSKRLFSSCPVLETLHIVDCVIQTDNQRNLIIDFVSLKEFEYSCLYTNQDDPMAKIIKLRAPNLEEFHCQRSFLAQDYSLESCYPLDKVRCDMFLKDVEDENAEAYSKLPTEEKDVYAKRILQFLGVVHAAKRMGLSSGCLEVLSRAPDLLDCQPPRLCNVEYWMLDMWSTRTCLRAMAYLLKISPHITHLGLEFKESNLVDVGDDWEAGLSLPGTILSHLRYVHVFEVEGCDGELKILGFLLRNAKGLEQVHLLVRSNVCSGERKRQFKRFMKKLRAVPRASSSLQLGFFKI